MLRLALNPKKPNNHAFFCPVSRLHLTRNTPSGIAEGVTPYILRGLKSKVLIDVDNVVNLETGKQEAKQIKKPEVSQQVAPTPQVQDSMNTESIKVEEPVKEEVYTEDDTAVKKAGRKSKN